jgi:hypothetical protein
MTVWRDLFDRATLVFAFYFSKTITLSQSAPLPKALAEIDEGAGLSSPQFIYLFDFLASLFPQQIPVKRRKSPVGRQ